MEFNAENYKKSLENIKASENFLAETKRLMLEEAARSEKPSHKPHIIKITSFAAAAACIALITVIGSNLFADKGIETTLTEQTTASTTEVSTVTQTETEAAEEKPVIAPTAEKITEEIADEAADISKTETKDHDIPEENIPSKEETTDAVNSEPAPDDAAPAPFAMDAFLNDTTEEETIEYEADEDSVSVDSSPSVNPNTSEEIVEDSDDDNETNDDSLDHPTDEGEDDDAPVAPAFAKVQGGNAADFPEFSPRDTEKLCEFLSLVSQDDINAEISIPELVPNDIFGEKALTLNEEMMNAAESLTPCESTDFAPELAFSVFDNKNGTLLYTVKIDGEIIAVSVKHGETVYFETSENISEAILSKIS